MIVGLGLGRDGLAALNLSIPMINIMNGIGLMAGIGGAARVSLAKGREDERGAALYTTMAIAAAAILGIILLLLVKLNFNGLVSLLAGQSLQKDMAASYLSTLLSFTPFFLLFQTCNALVRNDGGNRISMIAMLGSAAFNIVLDYIMIFPLKRGLAGGALATGLAQLVGFFLLLFHLRGKARPRLSLPFLPHLADAVKALFRVLATGAASLVLEWSHGLVIFAFNMVIAGIGGDLGISAYSVIANLSLMFTAILSGTAVGIQPLISRSMGAGRIRHKRHYYRFALFTATCLGAAIYFLGLLFPQAPSSLFVRNDQELVALSAHGIRLYFLAFFLMGVNLVNTIFLQSRGRAAEAFFYSILRGLVFILVALFILPRFFALDGVWLSMPAAEVLTLLTSFFASSALRRAFFQRAEASPGENDAASSRDAAE